jgi:hypothetical protein
MTNTFRHKYLFLVVVVAVVVFGYSSVWLWYDANIVLQFSTRSDVLRTKFIDRTNVPVISDDSFVCRQINASEQSFQKLWEKTKESVINVSLLEANWSNDLRTNTTLTDWVRECMTYFTYSRLQRTDIARPLDQLKSIGRIHSILDQKLKKPDISPPLRIVVFGGSVTAGHQCIANKFGFQVTKKAQLVASYIDDLCSWPGRLQDIFDAILGHGVIQILNMAVGGAPTDMSTVAMEFGLIPGSTPDIIIWDHGANDAAQRLNESQIFTEKLQPFYQATRNLPKTCNHTEPPLVIFLDAFLGALEKYSVVHPSLAAAKAVRNMVSWYPDTWGISYANGVRPNVLSNLQSNDDILPLLGSKGLTLHSGMMYHISIAWVVAFNFFHALHDNCISRSIELLSLNLARPNFTTSIGHLDGSHIPELTDKLHMLAVSSKWKERIPKKDTELCTQQQNAGNQTVKKSTAHSSIKCFYVWAVNRITKLYTVSSVDKVIQPYLINNEGWQASGNPNGKPGVGWLAEGHDSWFELSFDGLPRSVQTLTILYMKSYSEKWYNATLQIDFSIGPSQQNVSQNNESLMLPTESLRHFISGYHTDETSILVPEEIRLPSSNRNDEDTLRLKFTLIEGETFKITGMALC